MKLAVHVPLGQIDPPRLQRSSMNGTAMADLVASVKQHGVIQPILVVRLTYSYRIVAGLRRFLAAAEAKCETIPAMVIEGDEAAEYELGLVENIHRENLSPIDEANAIQALMRASGLSMAKVAVRIGKCHSWVESRLKLLRLESDAQSAIRSGNMTIGDGVRLANRPVEVQLAAVAERTPRMSTPAAIAARSKTELPPVNRPRAAWRNRMDQMVREAELTEPEGRRLFAVVSETIDAIKEDRK